MIVYVQLTLTKKPMGKVVVKLFENFRWTTWCDMVWHGQLPKSGTHSRFQPLDAASLKIEAWKSKERNLLIWKVKTCPKYIQIHPHPPIPRIPPFNPSPQSIPLPWTVIIKYRLWFDPKRKDLLLLETFFVQDGRVVFDDFVNLLK